MATITQFVDDLDGSTDNVRTVRFALDGKPYEIDLGAKSLEKLTKALEPFISKARSLGTASPAKPKGTKGTRQSNTPDYDKEAFKAWAVTAGKWTGKRPALALIQEFLAAQAQ